MRSKRYTCNWAVGDRSSLRVRTDSSVRVRSGDYRTSPRSLHEATPPGRPGKDG